MPALEPMERTVLSSDYQRNIDIATLRREITHVIAQTANGCIRELNLDPNVAPALSQLQAHARSLENTLVQSRQLYSNLYHELECAKADIEQLKTKNFALQMEVKAKSEYHAIIENRLRGSPAQFQELSAELHQRVMNLTAAEGARDRYKHQRDMLRQQLRTLSPGQNGHPPNGAGSMHPPLQLPQQRQQHLQQQHLQQQQQHLQQQYLQQQHIQQQQHSQQRIQQQHPQGAMIASQRPALSISAQSIPMSMQDRQTFLTPAQEMGHQQLFTPISGQSMHSRSSHGRASQNVPQSPVGRIFPQSTGNSPVVTVSQQPSAVMPVSHTATRTPPAPPSQQQPLQITLTYASPPAQIQAESEKAYPTPGPSGQGFKPAGTAGVKRERELDTSVKDDRDAKRVKLEETNSQEISAAMGAMPDEDDEIIEVDSEGLRPIWSCIPICLDKTEGPVVCKLCSMRQRKDPSVNAVLAPEWNESCKRDIELHFQQAHRKALDGMRGKV